MWAATVRVPPMNALALYLYAFMVAAAPLEHHRYYEAPAVTDARYRQIAADVADQVLDPTEAPLFDGSDGRAKTGLLALSVASFESGEFRAGVQWCGESGDGGASWGLFQSKRGKMVCDSLRGAVHVALEQIRESRTACAALPWDERLALYASGTCSRGRRESINRVRRATDYWAAHPFKP
jgi:hypothetical protein